MIRVDNPVAADLLRRDRYKFLGELIALTRNVPPVPREVYADADSPTVVMLLEHYPHSDFPTVTFTGYQSDFLREAIESVLGELARFGLLSFDKSMLKAPELRAHFDVGQVGCRRSFVCTCLDRVPAQKSTAVALTESNREAFVEYPLGESQGAPTRADLFGWFVTEGGGEILAVKEGDKILGYLSCSPEYENVWDVEFIHVRQEYRGKGLGTQLAASYARARLAAGQVPYWSGVANEASQRTARAAGFVCCRELFHAEASVKPRTPLGRP